MNLFRMWHSKKTIINDPVTKGGHEMVFAKSLNKKLTASTQEENIILFEKEALNLVVSHLEKTEFIKHISLMREINYLLYYTFAILKDDYLIGDKIFTKGVTKIDDYIFSQYRKNPTLSANIKKMTTLAFSNRFGDKPRENLLAYFVFIEETGFELIMLLEDFYQLLDTSKKKKFGFKKTNAFSKNYEKEEDFSKDYTQTLQTEALTEFLAPAHAQRKIIEDLIKKTK